ncbi:MAG: hypothetical protein MUF81_04815, partial [Verrucomicrobia bacterium]|nr:hypothetical protein [Verrucomicrobiota bacterium]
TKRAGMKVGSFLPLFVQNILKNLSAAKSDSLLEVWDAGGTRSYQMRREVHGESAFLEKGFVISLEL